MAYWDLIPSFCSETLPEELGDTLGSYFFYSVQRFYLRNSVMAHWDLIPSFCSEILPEELGDTLGSNFFILFRDFT